MRRQPYARVGIWYRQIGALVACVRWTGTEHVVAIFGGRIVFAFRGHDLEGAMVKVSVSKALGDDKSQCMCACAMVMQCRVCFVTLVCCILVPFPNIM